MMDEFDVNITIPPSRDESDQVVIIGTRPKVNKAIEALEQKVAEIEAENEDRVSFGSSLKGLYVREHIFPFKFPECSYVQANAPVWSFPQQLRSFKMEISVTSSYHPKIIGRKGQVIQKIRTDHAVQIQFPAVEASESEADRIVLTGYEHNCEAAKEAILKIVRELVGIYLL